MRILSLLLLGGGVTMALKSVYGLAALLIFAALVAAVLGATWGQHPNDR